MSTKCVWENQPISHAAFAAMVVANANVVLPDSALVTLTGPIVIPSGVKITTSRSKPATIRVNVAGSLGLCLQGGGITIENVRMDFNSAGVWNAFVSPIAFKVPNHFTQVTHAIEDVLISNVEFFDSGEPATRDNGDKWAINLANSSSAAVKNVRIDGCIVTAKRRQLTANGVGAGFDGLSIVNNIVYSGEVNSIAISTLSNNAFLFKDILISGNRLIDCSDVGIFVGSDAGATTPNTTVENVQIVNNYIEITKNKTASDWFPSCIFIRANSGMTGVLIERNVFNTSRTGVAAFPRRVTLTSGEDTSSAAIIRDNTSFGPMSNVISNVTVT